MEYENLIQLFLKGLLNQEGQKQLADLIENNPEVASQLEIESAFYAQRSKSLKAELRTCNSTEKNKDVVKNPTKFITLVTSIAAAVLLCVFCYFTLNIKSADQDYKSLASEFLTQKHTAPISLMGDNSNEENWYKAIQAYKVYDFKNVISSISFIKEPTDEQMLYSGISKLYLENPEPESAIIDFKKILMKKESLVDDQAMWFLALSQLKLNDKIAAKTTLTSIVKSKSWQHENAKQLLNSID